jgi:hypothetical protein
LLELLMDPGGFGGICVSWDANNACLPLPPPYSVCGHEGRRLRHWLPGPYQVPNFLRARFLASTLCLMYVHPP